MSDHFAVSDNDQSAGQILTPQGVKPRQQETPMDDSELRFTPSVSANTPSLERTGTMNTLQEKSICGK